MNKLLCGLAAMVVLASPAIAANMQPLIEKAPRAAHNWTGLYFGAHCGGAWGNSKTSGNNGAFDQAPVSYTLQPSGAVCGGQVGFNLQVGGWFWGIEADFGYLGLKRSIKPADNFVEVKYGAYGVAAARLGVIVDRALLYTKGGVAFAKIRNTASDLDSGLVDTSDFSEINKTRIGWAAGAGVEYGLSSSWSIKVEYLYMDFGKDTSSNLDGDLFSHRNSVHTAKVGFNWFFGGGPAATMNYD
jgi:outer membrane immunogenic protein